MDLAVTRWVLVPETQVQSRVSLCDTLRGHNGNEEDFSRVSLTLLC